MHSGDVLGGGSEWKDTRALRCRVTTPDWLPSYLLPPLLSHPVVSQSDAKRAHQHPRLQSDFKACSHSVSLQSSIHSKATLKKKKVIMVNYLIRQSYGSESIQPSGDNNSLKCKLAVRMKEDLSDLESGCLVVGARRARKSISLTSDRLQDFRTI